MRGTRFAAVIIAAMAVGVSFVMYGNAGSSASGETTASVADSHGDLHVPHAYRATYQYLGSWAVAADQGSGAKELHVVYLSPGAVQAYRSHGHFPDGAVLVKEVYAAATGQMTTGTVSHADTLKGWFVMMKDSRGRHPDNKLWGDGWGWSWFDANNPSKTTSTDYKTNCKACHVPAEASDWIYVSGYPSLKP
jgi:Cytochrome P460